MNGHQGIGLTPEARRPPSGISAAGVECGRCPPHSCDLDEPDAWWNMYAHAGCHQTLNLGRGLMFVIEGLGERGVGESFSGRESLLGAQIFLPPPAGRTLQRPFPKQRSCELPLATLNDSQPLISPPHLSPKPPGRFIASQTLIQQHQICAPP